MIRPCPAATLAACLAIGIAFNGAAFAAGEKKMADDSAIAAIDAQIAKAKVDKSKSDWKTHLAKPEAVKFDPGKTYVWVLDTTKGPIEIKLRPDVAPMHVTSTIYLTRLGFYDGVLFHRVIPGFMAQGGDPLGERSHQGEARDQEGDDSSSVAGATAPSAGRRNRSGTSFRSHTIPNSASSRSP